MRNIETTKKSQYMGFFLVALFSVSCSYFTATETKMEKFGPDVPASLVVYFKAGTTEDEIAQFDRDYLMVPRADGRGEGHRHRIRIDLRLIPAQANGYDGIALTFHDDASEEQRKAAKMSFESSGIVYKVFENIAPKDIKESDLK